MPKDNLKNKRKCVINVYCTEYEVVKKAAKYFNGY